MPSKKGKASSGNIGLKIDDELSFDKLKVAEKSILFILQLLQNLWRNYHRVLTSLERTLWKAFIATKVFSQIAIHFQLFLKTKF